MNIIYKDQMTEEEFQTFRTNMACVHGEQFYTGMHKSKYSITDKDILNFLSEFNILLDHWSVFVIIDEVDTTKSFLSLFIWGDNIDAFSRS